MRKTLAFRPAAQFEVTLGSASEGFRLRCQAQNLSVGTLAWYKQILKMFERFIETQGVMTARTVTPTLIRSCQLFGCKLSPGPMALYAVANS
jgi:hypothetical protein